MDSRICCPKCGRSTPMEAAAFCPFCGAELAAPPVEADVKEALQAAGSQDDPVKKHELLVRALEKHPDSLAIEEELLHLGRLYERNHRKLDYSVIKCYLLHIYRAPEELTADKRADMRRELFHDPQLERCLSLAPDADAFMTRYLSRLSGEYIRVFLRGDSRVMRVFWGFKLESRAAKLLAAPVAGMLGRIREDTEITDKERDMLYSAFRAAYDKDVGGDTRYLDEALRGEG